MITDTRVRVLARQDQVTAGLAEKNYVNSWILYAIYQSDLSDFLVFKGGTALSKLYFPDLWRFSEDLDFTAPQQLPRLRASLENALDNVGEESGISFYIRNTHQAGEPTEYVQINVQYDAILGQQNTTRLDITLTEPLEFPTVEHRHEFEDVPEFPIVAYSIEEIFVEKLRSLFQRTRARDYYDLYQLLQIGSFDDQQVLEALEVKSRAFDVSIDLDAAIPDREIEDVRRYWETRLDRLVRDKPDFDEVIDQIDCYLVCLTEHK